MATITGTIQVALPTPVPQLFGAVPLGSTWPQTAGRRRVPETAPNSPQHRQMLARKINQLDAGQLDCTFPVTLEANLPQTVIARANVSAWSHVSLMPQTASAAAEISSGRLYVTCEKGLIVINHSNSAAADRSFVGAILG